MYAVQHAIANTSLASPALPPSLPLPSPPDLSNQNTDKAVGEIFSPVLKVAADGFYFFSFCLLQRSPLLGPGMREKAGQRIAAKLGEAMPPWVKDDSLALHLYACRLGGVAVHKMVQSVRKLGDEEFYEEVAEAVGALLQGEVLIFNEYSSAARALASWSVGGMRGGPPRQRIGLASKYSKQSAASSQSSVM